MTTEFFRKYIDIINEQASEITITDDWFKNGAFKAAKIPSAREPFKIADRDGEIQTLIFWAKSRELL